MPSKILSPEYNWDKEKDIYTKIYKTKIGKWANKTQASLKNKLEKKEDFTIVSFVTIIHNGEADIGKTEAWERSTIIHNNNYHQNQYLIMELARGYLNPNSSNWKSLPLYCPEKVRWGQSVSARGLAHRDRVYSDSLVPRSHEIETSGKRYGKR